ncbi:MAG: HAMP domain-containing sensor histidine kinase [Acidimicrobiales bacterium]
MSHASVQSSGGATTNELRANARRVALRATLVALVGGVLICAIADVVAVQRVSRSLDAALSRRITALETQSSPSLATYVSQYRNASPTDVPDFDASTFLEWLVPSGSSTTMRLNDGTPNLPIGDGALSRLRSATIEGRKYLIEGAAVDGGRLIVGESTAGDGDVLSTLLVVQSILAPLALLALYLVATTIGRRAAAPIDRARRRQLDFAADASHELRTPLSVIQAEVSLALSATRSADQYRDVLERVSAESRRLRKIVDNLLWLARLDSIPEDSEHELVDVAIIAANCVDRFGAVAASRHISLGMEQSGFLEPLVMAPAEWLDELVSVLLDNATRYARDGGRVDLRVDTSESRVSLSVSDDGPGFGEGEHERLLERFHRASTEPGGAGLGLAIAGAVVSATKGEISLGISESGGAMVVMTWPRRPLETAPPGPDQLAT